MVRTLLKLTLAICICVMIPAASNAQKVSRAYGIQVYSESEPAAAQKLVSFSLDDPSKVTTEASLGGYQIMAAACHDDLYYMIHTEDELVPAKLITYNLKTNRFNEIRSYQITDSAGDLVILDMTYDPSDNLLYAVGLKLLAAEIVGGELIAPFGLFRIDPTNGEATCVGLQETAVIVSVASDGTELWGVDDGGNVWLINKADGELEDIVASTSVSAFSTQSMSYDYGNGKFYWASYTQDPAGKGKSALYSFCMKANGEVTTRNLGPIGKQVELIGMYIDPDPLDNNAPAGVSDFTVTPAPKGKNDAVLSWKNPTLTIGYSDLTGDLTLTLSRDDEPVTTLKGKPGEAMTWTDADVKDDIHTYSITVSQGNLTGKTVFADPIFIGTDIPGAPASVEAERTGNGFGISVRWTAPAIGNSGGWYDPSLLRYRVTRFPDKKIVGDNLTVLSLTDNDITVQEGYYYGVKTIIGGDSYGPEALSNVVISGPALAVPYEMTLTPEDELLWTVTDNDGDGYKWYVYRTGWAGTWEPFFRYNPDDTLDPKEKADDWIFSPTISLKAGENYVVSYDIRLLGTLFPTNTALWIGSAAKPSAMTKCLGRYDEEITDIEWENHTIPFTVDDDGDYNFGFTVSNRTPVQMYHFSVREPEAYDMMASSIVGPEGTSVGKELTYYVTVQNIGYDIVKSYTVKLTDGSGRLLGSTAVNKQTNPGAVDIITVKWTPAAGGIYNITASVIAAGDNNKANNSATLNGVRILDAGAWYDVTDGDNASGLVPFFTNRLHSAAQSVYTADMIGRKSPGKIMALTYYINSLFGNNDARFDAEIWLGNTTISSFNSGIPVSEEDMTKVFDGHITLSPNEKILTVIFDVPFDYEGDNLVIYTRHHADTKYSLTFKAFYSTESDIHSLVAYSETEPVGTAQMDNSYTDLPNVSIFFDDPNAIDSVLAERAAATVSYDRLTHTLHIDGLFDICHVYNVTGTLLTTCLPGSDMKVPAAEGIGLVEVITSSGRTVSKIVF